MDRRTFACGLAALGVAGAGRAAGAGLALRVEDGDLVATRGGRPLLRYRHRTVNGPAGTGALLARSGYLHPVHAPCGAVVTDDFNPDHLHQRGIWSAWTKSRVTLDGETLAVNFWDLLGGAGRVRSLGFEVVDPTFTATLASEARHRGAWVEVLRERWEVRFPAVEEPAGAGAAHVFDLTLRQTPNVPLELEKYHYGGMAVRGARAWGKGSDMGVLTSEGKDRAGADGARARWVDMSGTVAGQAAGIALLEHPANPQAPNVVRMHPEMPYYTFTLHASGPVLLEPGREYVFRYRVAAHDGRADRGRLDALWEAFAQSS